VLHAQGAPRRPLPTPSGRPFAPSVPAQRPRCTRGSSSAVAGCNPTSWPPGCSSPPAGSGADHRPLPGAWPHAPWRPAHSRACWLGYGRVGPYARRVRRAQEATELSALFGRVEAVFGGGDLPRMAATLASIRRGLALVGAVPEFRGGAARLAVRTPAAARHGPGSILLPSGAPRHGRMCASAAPCRRAAQPLQHARGGRLALDLHCIVESPRGKQCYRPCQPHAHAGAAAARRTRELARQRARPGRRALADPVGSAPSLTLGLPRRRWRSASRRWWSRRWRPRWAGATANARASWPRCWPAAGAARTLRACTPPRACPRCRRARGVARPHFLGGPPSALAAPAAAGWHGGHACRVCSGRCRCSLRPAAHETSQPGLTGSVAADGGWTAAPWQPTAQAAGLKRRRCGTNTRTGRWRPGCRASTRAWRRPRRPRRAGPRARCQTSTRRCRCACSPRCSRAWTGPAARGWRPRSRPVRQLPRPATAAAPSITAWALRAQRVYANNVREVMRAPALRPWMDGLGTPHAESGARAGAASLAVPRESLGSSEACSLAPPTHAAPRGAAGGAGGGAALAQLGQMLGDAAGFVAGVAAELAGADAGQLAAVASAVYAPFEAQVERCAGRPHAGTRARLWALCIERCGTLAVRALESRQPRLDWRTSGAVK